MKPAPFELHTPKTSGDILALLKSHREDVRILAGGQSLVPMMNFRIVQPAVLVSLNHCRELSFIRQAGNEIEIGALTRQREAETSSLVQAQCPLLARALPYVGGLSNRNRGTVCGSLAHADPLAELPAVAVALGAKFIIDGIQGRRQVAARDFYLGPLSTVIEPGEMLQAVHFPAAPSNSAAVFLEIGTRRHGFALAGIAIQISFDNRGVCVAANIAAMGGGDVARRLTAVETTLTGSSLDPAVCMKAVNAVETSVNPPTDMHATAQYRVWAIGELLGRALEDIRTTRGKL